MTNIPCLDCKVNYHRNFHVKGKQRIYCNEILQIGEHQFAETPLINVWISMMLFSWISASNCSRIYNTTSKLLQSSTPSVTWPFNLSMTSSQVYDAFTLLSLLEDCQVQKSTLVVLYKGGLDGGNRFSEAVRLRNERLRLRSPQRFFTIVPSAHDSFQVFNCPYLLYILLNQSSILQS